MGAGGAGITPCLHRLCVYGLHTTPQTPGTTTAPTCAAQKCSCSSSNGARLIAEPPTGLTGPPLCACRRQQLQQSQRQSECGRGGSSGVVSVHVWCSARSLQRILPQGWWWLVASCSSCPHTKQQSGTQAAHSPRHTPQQLLGVAGPQDSLPGVWRQRATYRAGARLWRQLVSSARVAALVAVALCSVVSATGVDACTLASDCTATAPHTHTVTTGARTRPC
jgi:hypothetical protein